jgi:hypothetical protein
MAQRLNLAWLVLSGVALALLGANLIATGLIVWLGDWQGHGPGLTLALRIVWGSWVVAVLALVLTRVTLFGWSFRRYFRWPGDEDLPPEAPRPTQAPWYKSGAASFAFTVTLVALTGSVAVVTAVLWILGDQITWPVFWLVFKILWGSWWVLSIALVVTRVSIFGWQRKKAIEQSESGQMSEPAQPAEEKQ